MKNTNEIYKNILDCLLNQVLVFTNEDWINSENHKETDRTDYLIKKDNIKYYFVLNNNYNCSYFKIIILDNNNLEKYNKYFEYHWMFILGRLSRTKEEIKIQNILNEKIKNLHNLLTEIEQYKKASEIYSLLPIKKIRKDKLETIENLNL